MPSKLENYTTLTKNSGHTSDPCTAKESDFQTTNIHVFRTVQPKLNYVRYTKLSGQTDRSHSFTWIKSTGKKRGQKK